MKRGDIFAVRGSSGWIEKARPALIVQNGGFEAHGSTVTCLFTTFESNGDPNRVRVEPSPQNGLKQICYVMTDKIVSVRLDELGPKIGTLEDEYLNQVSDKLRSLLGL